METDIEILPDESEQLDQLQPEETLVDRGVRDVLDEGYTTPEHWSAAEGFGNTPAEMREGETLEQRVLQEEPEPLDTEKKPSWRDDPHEVREVGKQRAGRLADAYHGSGDHTVDSDVFAEDVGISGGAACAEEAAMHIIDDSDDDDSDDE